MRGGLRVGGGDGDEKVTLATKASFEGWWLIGGRAPAVPSPSAPQSCPRQSRIRPHPVSIPFAFDLFFFKSFILTIRQFWECHLHFKKTQKPSPARICFSFFFPAALFFPEKASSTSAACFLQGPLPHQLTHFLICWKLPLGILHLQPSLSSSVFPKSSK